MTAVDDFMAALDSPQKTGIEAMRQIILAAHPDVSEGIKWNAPSFFYKTWFATFHLRTKSGIQLVLHRGAKVRMDAMAEVADPGGLLEWLSPDRATIRFQGAVDVEARREELRAVIRAWTEAL